MEKSPSDVISELAKEVGIMKPSTRVFEVDPPKLPEVIKKLVEMYGAERVFVSTIVGIDRPQQGVIEVDVFVEVLGFKEVYCLKIEVPRDNPRVPSIVDIVPSALVGELEVHDLLGVVFEGNVYLRRPVFVPEEIAAKGVYPLRKDFKG